jgi:protein-S-isoprenylcysteine O-methyltransferase Ste14
MLVFLVGAIVPLIYIKKKGFDPHGMHKNCSFLSKLTPLTITIWMIYLSSYIFFEETMQTVSSLTFLESQMNIIFGTLIVIIGYIIAVISIKELGINYRIDLPKEKTELITSGIFRYMRNPFYFGLYLVLLGNILIIPNVFSVLIFFINFVAFNSKAKDEEAFLLKTFGEKFELYKSMVGRYFPYKMKKRKRSLNKN